MRGKGFIAVVLLLAGLSVSCRSHREAYLRVCNWTEYIDPTVIPEFEAWYEQETGRRVTVDYDTYDITEKLQDRIERRREDYDVVCTSDYVIERMLNEGLLLPLDFTSILDDINYIELNKSPYIKKVFHDIHPVIDANDYSVAYMWGTTGILYNTLQVTLQEANTWDVICNPKFAGRIFVKDAPRDVYAPVLIHLKQKELKEGSVTLEELMHDSSDASMAAVEAFLMQARDGLMGWEADLGKEQMIHGQGLVSLNWNGDAVRAIDEAADYGVRLDYIVPEEGSTLWFDGWIIPKYSKNIQAATFFIDFMCRPDIAIRNMKKTGYGSANGSREILESQIDPHYSPIDLSYFFGPEADSVCVNPVLYADKSVIGRCALEHDWGKDTDKLLAMWSRIKKQRK